MPLKLIDKQVLYQGKRLRLELHHMEDDDGTRVVREICVHPGAVVILPFVTPDTILLIRNRRFTIGQYLIELPAGGLEKGEDPINAAGRELVEETGLMAEATGGRPAKLFRFRADILQERAYAGTKPPLGRS